MIFRNSICTLISTTLFATLLGAQQNAPPFSQMPEPAKLILANRLSQTKVADCADAVQTIPWGNTTTLHFSKDGLELTGRDLQGRAWATSLPAGGITKCEVWSASLRKGFPEDLLILNADPMGGKYATVLTILFFDKSERPHPWQAKGGFTSTKAGIQQLASDETSGNAKLIVALREGEKLSGYTYVYSLFKINANSVAKVVGNDGDNSWPIITGNRNFKSGSETKATETDSFETSDPLQGAKDLTLVSVLPLSEEERLIFSDGTKTRLPSIVVVEKTDGSRRIYFDGETTDGIDEIKRGSYAVRLKGTACEEEECRPFIILAKEQYSKRIKDGK